MSIIEASDKYSKQDDNELGLIIKFQKKVLNRLQYYQGHESLNVLRMINQGLKGDCRWYGFYSDCVQSIPITILSQMTLKQLIAFSCNYHQIKSNKQAPYVIENQDLEKIIAQELL